MGSQSSLELLNWDVLSYIVTFLPRPDLARFMQACHTFHAVGLRQLLRGFIELTSDNILSFYKCIQADPARRALFVRELDISCSMRHPKQSPYDLMRHIDPLPAHQLVIAILRNARNLKRLGLDWSAAGIRGYLRDVAPALIRLEELRIANLSQGLWEDLQGLHAPLRKLSVKFGPMKGTPVADPVALLAQFAPTLTELHSSDVQFQGGETQTTYPSVRTLSVENCYAEYMLGGIDVAPAMRAFPNVAELTFSAGENRPVVTQWLEGRSFDRPELIERCRRANKHALADGPGWAKLARVAGGHVIDLYMLGLEQHVPRVEISMLSEGTLHMLRDVLQDMRPASLALSLFAVDQIIACIPRLIKPDEATKGLSEFSLTLRCAKPALDIDTVVANVSALLAPLRVKRLTLELQCWEWVGTYLLSEEQRRAIDLYLDRIYNDAAETAKRFFAGVPSLRQVSVRVGDREVIQTV
ncbi:hypothetical protein BD413DRAFT_467627 [Trametes elegans]|nr:hypothetical protein BD413DRAFT_467627 [Trametes elegans]